MRTLLSGRKMKAADARTIQEIGIPSMVLMERLLWQWLHRQRKKQKKDKYIWSVCGSGNNGS